MKSVVLTFSLLISQPHAEKEMPAVLFKGLSDLHHPVSTKNKEAQAFFDQGLRLLYAFNHDEARRSFQRAADLDPDLAMAHWGVALSVGPNYNADADAAQRKAAHEAILKAIKLSPKANEPEKCYIGALAHRYSADANADKAKLALAYKNAM